MKRTAFNLNLILISSFIGLAILAHFTGAPAPHKESFHSLIK